MKRICLLFISLLILSNLTEISAQEANRKILDQFRWKNRLLLIFSPSLKNNIFIHADKKLQENNEGVVDRDLIIMYLFEHSQSAYGDSIINSKTTSYLRQKYYAAPGKTTFVLIGKDGGEKMRTINQFSIDRLFNRIDEMPMRRSEIEERTFSFDSIKFQ